MKKKALCVLLAALLLLLCGCTPAVNNPGPDPEPDLSAVESQIALLNENVSVWGEGLNEGNSGVFCVTDLDHNGRLELIASFVEGTGYFSTSTIYEVDETFEAIEEVDVSAIREASEPDLLFYDKYTCYEEDGVYYYICEDVVRNGYAEAVFYKQYISLENGVLSSDVIGAIEAKVEEERGEDVLKTAYYDDEGHNITPDDFRALETYWFRDDAKKTAIRFGWIAYEGEDDYSEDLTGSYNVFGPVTGYSADDDFFEYPYAFYNMKENVISGTGDDGMFSFPYGDLCRYWTFVAGETEGWEWTAEEEGVSCWVEFEEDGTASFSYTQYGETTRFDGMDVSADNTALYDGCENEEWSVVFRGDETNEFAATLVDDMLQLLWFQGPFEGEEYPAVCFMRFE